MNNDSGLIALLGKTFWLKLGEAERARMRKMYGKRLANSREYSQFKARVRT